MNNGVGIDRGSGGSGLDGGGQREKNGTAVVEKQ